MNIPTAVGAAVGLIDGCPFFTLSLPAYVFWEEGFRYSQEKVGGFAFVVFIEPVHVNYNHRFLLWEIKQLATEPHYGPVVTAELANM